MEAELFFELCGTVTWKESVDLDDEMGMKVLQRLCGAGPFTIVDIANLTREEAANARHPQRLKLLNSERQIVSAAGEMTYFSGFWFEKVDKPVIAN